LSRQPDEDPPGNGEVHFLRRPVNGRPRCRPDNEAFQ